MATMLSPGVYLTELDLSTRADGVSTSTGAIVFASAKGPTDTTLITGGKTQFLDLYGNPDPAIGFGHDSAIAFLQEAGALYCKRVVNDALHAGDIYYQDSKDTPTRTLSIGFPEGLDNSYLTGNHKVVVLNLQDKLDDNDLSIDITDGNVTQTATASFATDSNTTLTAFAAAIQTKLNTFGLGSLATVVKETTGMPVKEQRRITFSANFVSLNTINLNVIINGTSTAISPVTFNTSQVVTMNTLASAIVGAGAGNAYIEANSNNLSLIVESPVAGIDTLDITGVVVTLGTSQPTGTVNLVKQGTGVNDDRLITIVIPQTLNVLLENLQVDGSNPPAATIEEDVELFEVFSENPGAWGNDVGVKLTTIDQGINQVITLSINSAFVTSNSITGRINGTDITPVAFTTDSDTTLAALATTIDTFLKDEYDGKGSATVVSIPNSTSNDRQIQITAPDSVTVLTVTDFSVSGGASQPVITVVETLKNVPTTNTFNIEVYTRDNVLTPKETFTVSLAYQTDGFGVQQNISEVVNKSALKSKYIRIAQVNPVATNGKVITVSSLVTFLTGGDDGLAATSTQYIAGWSDFLDTDKYEARILINGGLYDIAVQQYITSVAEKRQDSIAVLDLPSTYQLTSDNSRTFRNNVLNINSSFAALYGPDLNILDQFTGVQRFVPPSGYIAAQYAFTDNTTEAWFSPAGLTRGLIQNILGLRVLYKKADLDIMYPSQINSIIQKPGVGFTIWGDKTLQSKSSSLSYVSVRRLVALIETAIKKALDFSVFEPNDEFTQLQVSQLVTNFLRPIKDKRGLRDFTVICDSRNNKNIDLDSGNLNLDVYLVPTTSVQTIAVRLILTPAGVSAADLNL